MRFLSLVVLSGLLGSVAACGGSDPEVCDDDMDNDGDETVDCDDADCAGTTLCSENTDSEEGGPKGPEVCDDFDGEDEDDDGDKNCADSDCAGTESCDERLMFTEIGVGTVTAAGWSGTGTQGWEVYALDATSLITPLRSACHVPFTQTGVVHPNATDCAGCSFAFDVAFSATEAQVGPACESESLSLEGEDGPFSVDGISYGYGYHPAYEYGGETAPALMYFVAAEGSNPAMWTLGTQDVSLTGDVASYAFGLSYPYYY